jgi:S-adenosylmethionine synthetase
MMPLSHLLANQLAERINKVRVDGTCSWMGPDAKVQVTIEYKHEKEDLTPLRLHTILISCQHEKDTTNEKIDKELREHVIKAVVPEKLIDQNTRFFMNPSGSFVTGGPCGDAGLTGR